MNKNTTKTKKEEKGISKEEKIEIIKKVFEYCKENYGLKDYTINISTKRKSAFISNLKSLLEDSIIINQLENFKISLNDKDIKQFYVFNNLLAKLELSEIDMIKTKLIFVCLHEIGHSLTDITSKVDTLSEDELFYYMQYNKIMYKKDIFINIANMEQKISNAIYKYNHLETPADYFAYSVLPRLLKEFNIETKYFDIKEVQNNKRFRKEKIQNVIKDLFKLKINRYPYLLNIQKINLKKNNTLNRYAKLYLENLSIPENNYKIVCNILELLMKYAYCIMIENYIDNESEVFIMNEYLKYIITIDDMIAPKFKKYIEKDWLVLGTCTIAFVEFPRIWRELQNKELI